MAEQTKIQWTDYSWSPWEGCAKISPGCARCYAEGRNHRFGMDNWGKGKPRRRTVDWEKPVRWNDKNAARMEIGSARRLSVFPSICDPFDDEVPVEWLSTFLSLIERTTCLNWLLLTKRPELWRSRLSEVAALGDQAEWISDAWLAGDPPDNVWIGTSVENQEFADLRIPALLDIPARLHFASYEPALGPVSFVGPFEGCQKFPMGRRLGWIIAGGESGPGARVCDIEWMRSVVGECRSFGVPVFVKQLGSVARKFPKHSCATGYFLELKDKKGGEMSEWPEDLRVRQFPERK